jgi:hypothetical protein
MKKAYKILLILFLIILVEILYLVYSSKRIILSDNFISPEIKIKSELAEEKKKTEAENKINVVNDSEGKETPAENIQPEQAATSSPAIAASSTPEIKNVIISVPFTPQAPSGEWGNPIFQDGCEEAASLMAVYWARGEGLDFKKAKEEIIAASDYEKEKYGEYRDASAEDTVSRIIKGYFNYDKVLVRKNIKLSDIIYEIMKGNLVILPMDGRALKNPYYTPPGPERHMIVVRGYDKDKKEFITNDPGTKRGEGYRYKEDVLFAAIRDYLTGHKEPILKVEKTMIVVEK